MRKAGITIEGRTGDTGPSYDTDPDFIRREARSQLLSRLSSRDLGRFISRLVASETGDVSYPSEPLDLRNFAFRGNRFGPPKPKRRSGRYGVQSGDLALFEKAIETEDVGLLEQAIGAGQGRMREDVRRMPAYLQRMIETARRARRRSSTFFPRTSLAGKPMSVHVPGRGLMEFSKKSGRGGSGGNKDIDRIVGQVLGQGWRIEKGKNHQKLVSPSGAPVFYPSSASDRRALQNFISTLRKKGAVVDGRGYGGKEGKGGPREMSRRSGSRPVAETAFGFVPDRRILEAIRRGDMSFGQEIGAQRLNTKRLSTTVSMGTGRGRVRGTAIAMIPENDRGLKGQRDGREVGRNLGQGDRKTRRTKLSPYSPMAEKVYEVLGAMLGAPTPAVVRRRLTPLEQQLATGGRLPQVGSSARTNIGATRRIASGRFEHPQVRQRRPLSRNAWMIPWLENFEPMKHALLGHPQFDDEIRTQATRQLGSTRDMRRIMLLDQILGQTDRHGSNMMVGKGRGGKRRILGIDNEHMFSMGGLNRPISDLDRQLNNTPQFSSFSARYMPRDVPVGGGTLLPWMTKGSGSSLSRIKLTKQEQDASAREAKALRGILGGKRSMKIVEESFLTAGYSKRDTDKYMETLRTRLEAAAITRESEAASGHSDAGNYNKMLQMSRRSGAQRKLASRTRATGRGVMLPQDFRGDDFSDLPRPMRLLGEMLQRKDRGRIARPVVFEDETRTSLVTGKEFIPGRASKGSRPVIPQNLAGRSPEQIFAEALVASHNAGVRVREIGADPERLIKAQLRAMGVTDPYDVGGKRIVSRRDQMTAARAYQLLRRQQAGLGSIASLAPGSVGLSSFLMSPGGDQGMRRDLLAGALDEMSGFEAFREVSAGTSGARRDRRSGQSGNRRIGLKGGFIATAPNRFHVPGMDDAAGLRNFVVGAMTHRMPGTHEQGKLGALAGLGVPGVGTSLMAYELRRHARATMEARRRYPGALEAKYGVSPADLPRLNMRPGSPGGLSLKASGAGMGLYEALGFEFSDPENMDTRYMSMGGDKVVDMYGRIRAEIKRVEARLAEQGIAYSPMEFARRSGKAWTDPNLENRRMSISSKLVPMISDPEQLRVGEEDLLGPFTRGTRFKLQSETYTSGPSAGKPIPRPASHRGVKYYTATTPGGIKISGIPEDVDRGRLQQLIASTETMRRKYPDKSFQVHLQYGKGDKGALGTADLGGSLMELRDSLFSEFAEQTGGWRNDFETLTPTNPNQVREHYGPWEEGKRRKFKMIPRGAPEGRHQTLDSGHTLLSHEFGHLLSPEKWRQRLWKDAGFQGTMAGASFPYLDFKRRGQGVRGEYGDMATISQWSDQGRSPGGAIKDFLLPHERINNGGGYRGVPGYFGGEYSPGSKANKKMLGSQAPIRDDIFPAMMRKIGELMVIGEYGPLASVLPRYQKKTKVRGQTRMPGDTKFQTIEEAMDELWKIGGYRNAETYSPASEWYASMFERYNARSFGQPGAIPKHNMLGYRVARIIAKNSGWAEYSKRSGGIGSGIGGMLGGIFGKGKPNIMQQITGGQTYGMTLEDLLSGDIMGMGKNNIGHWSGGAGKEILALKTLTGEVRNVLAQPMEGQFPNKAMEILAGLLGVDTPTILERSIGGRRMAIQPMAPGETAIDFVNKRNAPPSKMVDVWEDDEIIGRFSQPLGPRSDDPNLRDKPWLASRGGRRMQILDHLGQTFDRHGLNYLLNLADPKGGVGSPGNYRVTAIDHDLTLSPPGTGRMGQQPYRPASDVPIGIPGKFRDTQTKLAREEAATLAGIMTRRKVIEPQLLEALRAGGYSEQEALATVDSIFRRAREAFRSRMAESRGAARPDGRELSRRSGGGGMNGLRNPLAEYSKRSGGAATKDPYTSLQTAFEQVTLTAIKNLKVSLAGQKMNPGLFRQSIESFQKSILDAATGQGEFAGGSMQKALKGIAPKARKSLMGMFSGILGDIVETGTAAFESGQLKGIPLRKVLFSMLGQVPSTYAPDIAQIAANPALQGKKPSGRRDRIPGIAGINKYAGGLQQLGGVPISSGLRLAGSATLDQHLLDQGFNPENYRGRAGLVTDLVQKYIPSSPGLPSGLRFTDTLTPDRDGRSSWGHYMPSRGAGMVGPGTAYPDDRVGQISLDLGSQGGMRRNGLDRSTVTIGKLLATTAHEITHKMVDEAQLEAAKLSIGKTDAEKEEILKKVTAARGVPQKDKYRAYSGISGEYMFVPKGSAPIGARPIPLGSEQNPEGYSYMELPKGSITESQYKALSPKAKASYEPGYVTADQARKIDSNAGGQHINVPGHFGPQAAMLDDFGAGVTEYAQLLAASTRILQPGETEASLLRSTAQMNAGSRANITSFSAATPGVAGVLNPFQGGLLKAFDLSPTLGVGTAMKPVAEFLGALQRNMSAQMTDSAAAGGLDPKDLGGMFTKALAKAIEATPKGERANVLSAIRPERMLDAAVILDSIGRAKNIPALTRMIDAGGAVPAVSSPHGILASDAETDADVQRINRELARGGGRGSRRGKPAPGPAPTPGAGPGSLPPDRVAVISPKGADLLSKLTEILSMGLSGGGKENIPLRKVLRKEAGLPDRPLTGTQLATDSLTSSGIAALAEQFPELLPFVREYRPDHPLLGAQPGSRVPATKRGRRGGPVGPTGSGSTAVQPYVDTMDPDYYQNQADAFFSSRVTDAFNMLGGQGGLGYSPRGFGNHMNVLLDAMPEDQLQGGIDKLKQFGATMKDAFLSSKPVVGLMQDFDDAVLRAADGSLDFSKSLDAATASSGGLVNQLKETVKLAVAFVLTQNAANAIYRSISHLSSGFIQFNQSLEDAKVGFSTLFYNAGDSMGVAEGRATGMIERLKEFANVTPFYFTQLQEAAVRMQAFGLDIGQVLQRDPNTGELVGYIKNIGDAVAALGGGDEKIMRITYALGQMNSAGRVYQNDMMQLANAGIAGYEILAEALINELEAKGKDMTNEDKKILNDLYTNRVEAIRKLTTSGRISGKASAAAILSGLGEKYGGGMERLSKTMTGALSTVSDMSQSLVATMTGPLYNAIRDLVVDFAGVLQSSDTKSIFVELGQKLHGFAATVKEAIPATVATIVNAFTYLGGIIAKVFGGSDTTSAIDLLRSGMKTIGDLLSNNVVRAAILASVALKAMMSVVTANPLIATIGIVLAALGALRQAYESNFLGFADTVDNAMAPLTEMGPDIAESIIPALKDLIAAAAQVIGGGLVIALKAALPIISALAGALGGMAGILEKLAPLIGTFMGAWIVKKVAIEGMAILFTKLQNAAASAATAAGVAGVNMESWGKKGSTYYAQRIPVESQTMQTEDGPVTVYRSAAPEQGAGAVVKNVSIGDAEKARGSIGGSLPFQKMFAVPEHLRNVQLPYLANEGIRDANGNMIGLDPASGTAFGARPENMVLRRRTVDELAALQGGGLEAHQIAEAKKVLRGDQNLQQAGLIDVSETGAITASEKGKRYLREKIENERQRRAFDNDITVEEQVKRDQAEAASIRQANKEGRGILGYVPRQIPDYAITPAQLTPEEEVQALRGLKGQTFKEGFNYNYTAELSRRHAEARAAGRYRTGLDGSEIPNLGLTGKLRARGSATIQTVKDMFAMGGKTEMVGTAADKFGSLAMAASGLMMGFDALGSTLGISTKDMQGFSTALMGLSIVSKGVAAAMAGISAAGGVKNALGGLLGSMGGGIGATIMAGMAAAMFAASELSKHEAEKQKYLDQRKEDRTRQENIRKNWNESGLGFQVPQTVNGQAQYDVYGFSDGKTLGGNIGQGKMDEMVAQGLFKKEATATAGKFTYTPTETGRAKGYISAKALTRAEDPTFTQVPRAALDRVDSLLTSSTGGLFESSPAERLGQENADQLQALLQAGVISEDVIAGLVADIRSEDNRGFLASLTEWRTPFWTTYGSEEMKAKYGSVYTDNLSTQITGATTLDTVEFTKDLMASPFRTDAILNTVFGDEKSSLRGYEFTGKYAKEGVPNEAIFSTSESLKLLNDSLDDASKALDEAKKKLSKLFDPFATAFEQLMGRAKELLQKEFELEQQQLNAEMEDALYNVDALYNGETMRLGVLEEQYKLLQEQKAEQEKLNALNDAQENAARATLGLFDAQQDPIQAAIAAREAAQKLQKEEQNYQLNQMGDSIEQAKGSVQYQQTTTYYDEKKATLTADQAERSRRLEERAQQLLKDIQEGKITVAAAQEEFMAMFEDAGLPLESILETGQIQGEALADIMGTAFATRFQELGDIIATTMADVVKAGIAAAAAEANVDAIVEQIDKIENKKDKIKKKDVEAERERLKQVLVKSRASLLEYGTRIDVVGTDTGDKAVVAANSMTEYIKMLSGLNFDKYGDFLTRAQFGTEFDAIYSFFDKVYGTFGELQTVAVTMVDSHDRVPPPGATPPPTKPRTRATRGPKPTAPPTGYLPGSGQWLDSSDGLGWSWWGPNAYGGWGELVTRAKGGPVGGGQYLVGERGPEMLTMFPNGGGYVTPNHELPNSIQSSAGALKAGKQGRYYGGLVGVTGRAGGGYVGPNRDTWNYDSPSESFTRSLGFIGDPTGFEQYSFNDFMNSQSNTRAQKNELARRFPKLYARYIAGRIRSGGPRGWSPVMGRADGGYLGGWDSWDRPQPTETPIPDTTGGHGIDSWGAPIADENLVKGIPAGRVHFLGDLDPIQKIWNKLGPNSGKVGGSGNKIRFDWGDVIISDDYARTGQTVDLAALSEAARLSLAAAPENMFDPSDRTKRVTIVVVPDLGDGVVGRVKYPTGPRKNHIYLSPQGTSSQGQSWDFNKRGDANTSGYLETIAHETGHLVHSRKHGTPLLRGRGIFSPLVSLLSLGTQGGIGLPMGILERVEKKNPTLALALARIFRLPGLAVNTQGRLADLNRDAFVRSAADQGRDVLNWAEFSGKSPAVSFYGMGSPAENYADSFKYHVLDQAPGKHGETLGEMILGPEPRPEEPRFKHGTGWDQVQINDPEAQYKEELLAWRKKRAVAATSKVLAVREGWQNIRDSINRKSVFPVDGKDAAYRDVAGGQRPDSFTPTYRTGSGSSAIGAGLQAFDKNMNTKKGNVFASIAADIGQMAASGQWDFGRLIFNRIFDLVGAIPMIGGKLSIIAGLATTLLSGGDVGRAGVGMIGSVLGEWLGSMALAPIGMPWLGGFVGGIIGGALSDAIYTNIINPAAASKPNVMVGGGKYGVYNPGPNMPFAPGRAFGGSIGKNMPYLVGERGPELMIPDSSGYMLPNTGLRALQAPGDLRMAGGGATINASVTINNPVVSDAADIDKLAEKVSSAQVRTLRAAGFMRPS
jgi:tape measure domain-containing protein